MIKSALLRSYRIQEFSQFMRNVLMIVGQHNPDKLKIKALYNALNLQHKKLQEAYKQNPVGDATPQLSNLDKRRDQALICLQKVSKGYFYHDNEKKVAASKQISTCIAKYGSRLYQLNYGAETAALKNLVRDLQTNPACMAALQELHLTDVVDVISQANTEFEALFVQRLEKFSQYDTSKELALPVTEAYRTLLQHVEAHATLTPSEGYTSLIGHMNENIDHFNKIVARRKSMGEPDETDVEVAAHQEKDTPAV